VEINTRHSFRGYCLVRAIRVVLFGIYTVDQNERASEDQLWPRGTAGRQDDSRRSDLLNRLRPEERDRYCYPQVRVIPPGGPYFKMPWQTVRKIVISTNTINMAVDPEQSRCANAGGTMLDAVTKDQLNTGLTGQIRYRVSENNLYAYSVRHSPAARSRDGLLRFGAAAEDRELRSEVRSRALVPAVASSEMIGVSINDLRKNLRDLNEYMDQECRNTAARYGVVLDASLITSIDPPPEVESALAAINTAHNQVSSDISLAQASADQKIVQSKRAVEIETLQSAGGSATDSASGRTAGPVAPSGARRLGSVYHATSKLKALRKVERNLFGCARVMDLGISPFIVSALVTFLVMFFPAAGAYFPLPVCSVCTRS
jgi:regulator of protease activity HflC (stomatin/prohibitin superfamily)